MKKILLLTDMPPTPDYTAGIVLDKLTRFIPRGFLACFSVIEPSLKIKIASHFRDSPIEYAVKPREDWAVAYQIKRQPFPQTRALIKELYIDKIQISRLVTKIVAFAKKVNPDILWCILEGQTMIRLALPVAKALNVNFLTEVWDPPGWWLRDRKVPGLIQARILKQFGETISASSGCATASEEMAIEYQLLYGTETFAFLPSLNKKQSYPPAQKPKSDDKLTLGIAGQLYAMNEWQRLINVLDSANWKINKRDIEIKVIGKQIIGSVSKKANIHFVGWNSQLDTIKILSDCDILYCPYWFDSRFETEARLCFPSKLTSYLAAGRPVFFHGPEYASPALFLKKHKAGLLCHSLRSDEIISMLGKLTEDNNLYQQLTVNGNQAFMQHLTLRSLKNSFNKFLASAGCKF